jgi:hypothetical protein
MKSLLVIVAAAVVGAACSSEPEPPPQQRTKAEQRAVDSAIGQMKLPGTAGVRGALAASDSLAARNAQIDSLSKTP